MKKTVLHMIGNSHIDPVWFWNWEEGMQEVKATLCSALDRKNEFPELRLDVYKRQGCNMVNDNAPYLCGDGEAC